MHPKACLAAVGTETDTAGDTGSALDAALASRALWKDLCETVVDLIFETDRSGRFVFLAPAGLLGYQSHDLIGHLASDLLCGWSSPNLAEANPFAVSVPSRMQHVWLRRHDGSASLFAISARPVVTGGTRGIGIDVTAEDTTVGTGLKAVLLRAMLDRIQARMRDEVLATRIVRTGLAELSDCLGAEGAAVIVPPDEPNGPVTVMQQVGQGWKDIAEHAASIAHPDAPPSIATTDHAGRAILACSSLARFGMPVLLLVWRLRSGWRDDEQRLAAGVAEQLRSVLERDSIQRELTSDLRTDVLTGLLSRRSFLEETRRRFDRLDRNGHPATLMALDVRAFAGINDRHGIEHGDDALCQVAAFLRDTFRPTDLVCRTAGDGFAVWLDGADIFAAAERAEQICQDGVGVVIDGVAERIEFAIGLACRPGRSLEDLDSLIRRAETAMADAKRAGNSVWRASQPETET